MLLRLKSSPRKLNKNPHNESIKTTKHLCVRVVFGKWNIFFITWLEVICNSNSNSNGILVLLRFMKIFIEIFNHQIITLMLIALLG